MSSDPRFYSDEYRNHHIQRILHRSRRGSGWASKIFGSKGLINTEVSNTSHNNITITSADVGSNSTFNKTDIHQNTTVKNENISDSSTVIVHRGDGPVTANKQQDSTVDLVNAIATAMVSFGQSSHFPTARVSTTSVPTTLRAPSGHHRSRFRGRKQSIGRPKSSFDYSYDDYNSSEDGFYFNSNRRTEPRSYSNRYENSRSSHRYEKLSPYEEERLYNRIYRRILSEISAHFKSSDNKRVRRDLNFDNIDWNALLNLTFPVQPNPSVVRIGDDQGVFEVEHYPDRDTIDNSWLSVSLSNGSLTVDTKYGTGSGRTIIRHTNPDNSTDDDFFTSFDSTNYTSTDQKVNSTINESDNLNLTQVSDPTNQAGPVLTYLYIACGAIFCIIGLFATAYFCFGFLGKRFHGFHRGNETQEPSPLKVF